MKRRRAGVSVPPEYLLEFDEGDWSGDSRAEKVSAWTSARKDWYEASGWPGGFVTLLREHGPVRRG